MKSNNYNTIFLEDERVDGADKVTGKAKYTAEHNLPNLAYAVFVTSTIAKGTIKNLDTSKALAMPGVLDIIYYGNCFFKHIYFLQKILFCMHR